VIDYLRTENAVLKEAHGRRRIRLTDDQRRRLAAKGKPLGRRLLGEMASIVTPDTILRWHRELIRRKWDYSERRKRVGRPPVRPEVAQLAVEMARDNPSWGYDRIQGALANLGFKVSDATVGSILRANGLEPAPRRKRRSSWRTFLRAHWDVLAAIDFTTVEVWTRGGLTTYYLLFVVELSSRKVYFAGCTPNPDGAWMKQVARNATDCVDGFLLGSRYLLMDRDGKFTAAFRETLAGAGVEAVLLPPRSPNLNAYIERFMRSLKEECLDRMIVFGEASLRRATSEFIEHYHRERNHQGVGNRLLEPDLLSASGEIGCRERLGGRLRYYCRDAA
jgi:transposase InsO family protein